MYNFKDSKIKDRVYVFDTTLRDGEQSPGASMNASRKLTLARQLENLGVDIIEAGFAASSKEDYDSIRLIARQVRKPIICSLARATKDDILKAWQSIENARHPRIHTFIATSQIHMEKKLRKSEDEVNNIVHDAVSYAKSLCDDVEFTPEDSSRTDIDYMCRIVKTAISAGANVINIADTVGYAQPQEFYDRIRRVVDMTSKHSGIIVSAHCHDDLGLAVANSLAAVRAGARQVECTINGIGERAGNCSLEEFVMNLNVRKDNFNGLYTMVQTKELFSTSRLLCELTGLYVQRNKAIVGANAFSHEAGIHQHGVLSDKNTYEIMSPDAVGWRGENIVIGKHSGKHAIIGMLSNNGQDPAMYDIDRMLLDLKDSGSTDVLMGQDMFMKISEYKL